MVVVANIIVALLTNCENAIAIAKSILSGQKFYKEELLMSRCSFCNENLGFFHSYTTYEWSMLEKIETSLDVYKMLMREYHPDFENYYKGLGYFKHTAGLELCHNCLKNLYNLADKSYKFDDERIASYKRLKCLLSDPSVPKFYNLVGINNRILNIYIDYKYTYAKICHETELLNEKRWEQIKTKYDEHDFVFPDLQRNDHVAAARYKHNLVLVENRHPWLNDKIPPTAQAFQENFQKFCNADAETIMAVSVIPIDNIVSFQSSGSVEHSTTVIGGGGQGGGVNTKSAVVGGLLFGAAGAIIGAQKGTEICINPIESTVVEHDNRKTIFTIKNENEEIEIKTLPYYYAEILTKVIPEKDFNVLSITNNTKTQSSESPEKNLIYEMTQLKELLDMNLITQEEFDAKKKQVLGL